LPHYSSGTEVLTYETAKDLIKRGHNVSIFTGMPTNEKISDHERFGRYIYEGIPVECFYFNREPMGVQTNPLEMEYNNQMVGHYFKSYIDREKPDVVHFFHLAHLSASPIDACVQMGVPTVYTPTDFWFMCPLYELRFPENKMCPGPDAYGLNCLRHYVYNTQSPRFSSIFQRIPGFFLRPLISLIGKTGGVDSKYSPMISAVSKRQLVMQKKINLIDKILIPTKVMYSNLVRNGLDKEKVIRIPFGINLEYIKMNQRGENNSKEICLGYIGTLSEHKGAHVLIKAVRLLSSRAIRVKIYGKVSELSVYYKKLKQLSEGDTRIEFCGTFPNSKIGEIFSDLDALVVPSLWHENSPLVIYSAQYAKCPVVASNMAGMAEIVNHGVNGLLFESGNEIDLAEKIDLLLSNRKLLKQMSDNAPTPLSIQEYVDEIVDVYNSLLKRQVNL